MNKRGQALIEFILVLPILLLLIFCEKIFLLMSFYKFF